MRNILNRAGVNVGSIKDVTRFEDLKMMVPRDGSVLLTGVHLFKNGNRVGGHAIYLFRENNGSLKIMDRTQVYDSLEVVAHRYGVDSMVPSSVLEVKNILGKVVGPSGTGMLAIELKAVVFEE